jgi:folylpolyglutamate synthase
MALHTYMSSDVGTAIVEVGIGGEYDSTNILVHPSVTAITSLGIDHVPMLGSTIEEISWHKAGIMKSGTPCFTAPQSPAALEVLKARAREKNVNLTVVDIHPELGSIKLGLAADFQRTNASLAIAVAAIHLHRLGHTDITTSPLPPEFKAGLEQVRWSGRCETRKQGNISWHLDGGHTLESIDIAARWYASVLTPSTIQTHEQRQTRHDSPKATRVLIFNQQLRAAEPLLLRFHQTLCESLLLSSSSSSSSPQPFTHVLFCTNVTFRNSGYRPDLVSVNTNSQEVGQLSVQTRLAQQWKDLEAGLEGPKTRVSVLGTVEEAVDVVRGLAVEGEADGDEIAVLVTGSVHLVGGVLEVLESELESAARGATGAGVAGREGN